MQTNMVFAVELNKDFVGQYYGSIRGIDSINETSSTDYRKQVLAAIQAIATDSLAIMSKNHLSSPALSMRLSFNVDPDTAEPIPRTEALTYVNGTYAQSFPSEALIYVNTIYNLVNTAISAVNLDLLNNKTLNIFKNATFFHSRMVKNPPPPPINSSNSAEGFQTFYYGNLAPGYQTWAEMLLDGKPVSLGNPTGLPEQSAMVVTYLCPAYKVKPTNSLLSSVFVGSATMTLSVWGVWMLITSFVAKRISPPRVQCVCEICEKQKEVGIAENDKQVEEAKVRGPKTGLLRRFKALAGIGEKSVPSSTSGRDGETVPNDHQASNEDSKIEPPKHIKHLSEYSTLSKGE
ncbi:unnamed protein product [Rhizoctonia solani]|uniref:Transmembrane protein n=1 Tax=Rhizoctonia solani TaxID=456999 RepID=A0A8H3H5N4_9AGAM|nr:unnamed protein product [Rhizoctonia solani]